MKAKARVKARVKAKAKAKVKVPNSGHRICCRCRSLVGRKIVHKYSCWGNRHQNSSRMWLKVKETVMVNVTAKVKG